MDQGNPPEPIAIIGTACRLPGGASSPSRLWKLLKNPRDLLRDIPHDRFHWGGFYRADGLHGSIKTHKSYFLDENIREFDPDFFKLSPAEAENIDPQHRLLLENIYEAIESAGLCLEDLQGTDVGVFVGTMANEYYDNANHDVDASCGQILTTGTARSMAASRISYTFDFRGPSISIDTACSSSLMAVHLAVSSLRRGETSVAFACGAHLILTPNSFKALSRMGMLSADGRSKMFDEAADGYGRGEGTAVVCLKPLSAAIRDRDPVECIIRETGTNQDGRTRGITMPSAEAQAKLIRKTYARAGLDPTQASSRPSFFEAHGTGTFVGDPIEASAVESAFFPPGKNYDESESLYIGSIKTIIGHTEGTAGLAGLLRAALAVRHATIPPNLLFNRMNPEVQPHTKHLRLLTSPGRWPALPKGCPRRASVNSFGFGGSNVHVIIESYTQSPNSKSASSLSLHTADVPMFTPFIFSGPSERALAATLQNYLTHIQENKHGIPIQDLAWTLQYKRSQFHHRYALAASSIDDLEAGLQRALSLSDRKQDFGPVMHANLQSRSNLRIMGIFTGQGAQWATMGKELIERSPYVRMIVERLDEALASLPATDRPDWKLREELLLDGEKSRISEAMLAQPLTTAIQILLVDLVAVAGLKFHTVVGHSSGEIAAAYVTGLLNASDAIRVAYYRGLHSREARSKSGKSGAMFAAALSPDQAQEFCCLLRYKCHLTVAAFNSPSLVTISGDSTHVARAIAELEDDGTFVRRLQVDMAYHSKHMSPCAAPYLRSLKRLQIPSLELNEHFPAWYSSVFPGKRVESADQLRPAYWIQNLLAPMQFVSAVQTAVTQKGVPDMVLEIGPHPTLEKAVRQVLGDSGTIPLVYTGFLKRGISAVESYATALGHIWTRHGRGAVDFASVEAVLSSHAALPKQLRDLPTYAWLHDAEHWCENRFLRKRYQSTMPPIELLGEEWDIGASHESKWRSFLDPRETPWLLEHRLNGVAVLPGAAYVVMATTAARRIFRDEAIVMIDIQNIRFDLPLLFPDENTAIETVLTIVKIEKTQHDAHAEFYVDFCSHPRNDELMTAVRGQIHVRFGFNADRTSPEILTHPLGLTTVNREHFYKALSEAGYGYSGPFKAVESIQRRINFATGEIAASHSDLIIHPATLDGLFQASFAAESYPADSAMPNFRVPTCIRSIKIFPTRCQELFVSTGLDEIATPAASSRHLATASPTACTRGRPSTVQMEFDVHRTSFYEYAGALRSALDVGVFCQIEGLVTVPFRLSTADDDLTMFREVAWVQQYPDHVLRNEEVLDANTQDVDLALACERVAFYYLRKLLDDVSPQSGQQASSAVHDLIDFARLTVVEVTLGEHPTIQQAWLSDDIRTIHAIHKQYPDSVDLQLTKLMGAAYPLIIRGMDTAVNVLFRDGGLSQFYRKSIGFPETNQILASFVSALTNRLPISHILEVGTGTGASTEAILAVTTCPHYIFTDVSSAFFDRAKETLRRYQNSVSFKTFDMEMNPLEQGLTPESFDIIVASNVLHATSDVRMLLRNVRSLIRPGGHLVCVELADGCLLRNTVIMGGLPGWWLGHRKDRFWTPALSENQWDVYLKASGFSGLDCITPAAQPAKRPYRVFFTQAVDERVQLLRNPLQRCAVDQFQEPLLVIGDAPTGNANPVTEVLALLRPLFVEVVHLRTLEEISDCDRLPHTVLSIVEIQEPFFKSLTAERWNALQTLLGQTSNVAWVTMRAFSPEVLHDCYSNMTVGLMRTVRNEMPHLNVSILDLGGAYCVTAREVANTVLRQHWVSHWESTNSVGNLKYTQQTEVSVRGGTTYVPVIKSSAHPNDRYNARHRKIQTEISPSDRSVEVSYKRSKAQYVLRGVPQALLQPSMDPTVSINVQYTTLFAIRIKHVGSYFLSMGFEQNGESVVALSDVCRSKVQIQKKLIFTTHAGEQNGPEHLRDICAHFVAERLVGSSRPTGVIVVLVADSFLVSIVQSKAAKHGKKVLFMTSQPTFEPDRATFVHHHSLDLSVRQKVSNDTTFIANLSTHPDDEVLFQRICSVLRRSGIKTRGNEAFFEKKSTGHASGRGLGQCHMTAGTYLNTIKSKVGGVAVPAAVIRPDEAAERAGRGPSTLIDWTTNQAVPVTISPATKDVKLSSERTYLVIGSSDVARAICEWMVDSGARYMVMASRHPDHAEDWAQGLIIKGIHMRILAMDVTDRTSVRRTLASLRDESLSGCPRFPPIAGVMHLALVLHDAAFINMAYEDIKSVMDVKAEGSLVIHEELRDEVLDFFIMTSSISYVTGNRGQANYAAGNAFMVGLAKYRRSLGLPASVVHLGHVSGIGCIQRHATDETPTRSLNELRKHGLYPISERDLHHIFAEAVLASPANSGIGPEIITGIRNVEPEMLERCFWAKDPMFAHLISERAASAAPELENEPPHQRQLSKQLAEPATTSDDIRALVTGGLARKLGALLQMDKIDETKSLLDLGIDSLVAAEIGSWARKELRVQIPNSLIFGGASMSDVVDVAVRHLDRGWVKLKGSAAGHTPGNLA